MYRVVNEALNGVFLGGRFESRPLYLVLDRRGREELASALNERVEDVEASCCKVVGQQLSRTGDPYGDLSVELFKWRAAGRKSLPPFTALLFTLSHAAELMVSDGQFTSSNYYRRLAGLTDFDWQRLSLHGKSTEAFWTSFNKWLADTDFQYGRPTARVTNTWKYVSLAMSQAIVREEDRQRFHDLFEKYGFTGTDAVTEEEISHYIASWITSSKPTKQLRAAWAKAELRDRICEAAVAELEEWAQENETSGAQLANRSSRLSLAVSFRHDLLSRGASLWVGKEASVDDAELCFGDTKFQLANSTFGSFATVEPRASIEWGHALLRGLEFTSGDGARYSWAARAVVPLSRSEKGSYWTEVNRVTLGVPHIVLCRAEPSVRNSVERALEEIAAPGYTVATPASLSGLPAGWLLYENVRVIRALEELRGFEAALSPVGTTSGLQLVGGLRLGRGIWHAWSPPTAVFEAGDIAAKLLAWEGTSNEGRPQCEIDSEGGEAKLDLSDCVPPSGNLYIEGWRAAERLSSSTILLRTAAKARPLDRQSKGLVAYRESVSAAAANGMNYPSVRGMIIPDRTDAHVTLLRLEDFDELGKQVQDQNTSPEQPDTAPTTPAVDLSKMQLPELLKLPCAVRGFHVFKLDTVPPDYPKHAPVNMVCKDCRVALLMPRRSKKTDKKTSIAKARKQVPPSPVQVAQREWAKLPLDLWLDASCFLGSGTQAAFEGLVASEELDPWEARAVLKDLSWLAHVDVELGSDHRPKSWSIAPPALAFTGELEAVLTGFRNRPLLNDITQLIEAAGGTIEIKQVGRQPLLIVVRGLTASEARSALDVACDVHGRLVAISENAPQELAHYCLTAGTPFSTMRPMTLGTEGALRKYDVERGRWRLAETTSELGAYSFSYAGNGYAVRLAHGAFSGPPELVKIAAARIANVKLHAYHEKERVFVARLGCEPPGLLGRALVACSGRLPDIIDGTSRFKNVPPIVAQSILTALYSGDLPS